MGLLEGGCVLTNLQLKEGVCWKDHLAVNKPTFLGRRLLAGGIQID